MYAIAEVPVSRIACLACSVCSFYPAPPPFSFFPPPLFASLPPFPATETNKCREAQQGGVCMCVCVRQMGGCFSAQDRSAGRGLVYKPRPPSPPCLMGWTTRRQHSTELKEHPAPALLYFTLISHSFSIARRLP